MIIRRRGNSIYKKEQFILLIYNVMFLLFYFIFILGIIIRGLELILSYKKSSHVQRPRDFVMKHPAKKNKFNVISQKRCFSTYNHSRVNKIEDPLSIKSLRKTLKSPLSRPYEDLYKGRGKPKYEPE